MPLSAHSPRPKIICRESFFHLRRIKEAPYIKSNSTINRDNGVPASEVWGALINEFQCCDFAELITCIVPMCLFKHLFHSTADGGTRSVLKYTLKTGRDDPSYSSGASDDKDSPGYLKDAPAKCFPQLTAPSVQRLVTGAYCEASHCRYSHCSHLKVSAYGLIKG
ncbi:hypothetical protein M514_21706 [Trichuris suis]|uniref:Uncharacterized protein n=1 Tax=Trichuris suis TaxID=68888 RepID=A0A085N9P6_9BILA|nr:hypothetical protein M514_21706 [Trichuris suis]